MNWVLQVDSAVYKILRKIPGHDARRILFAIETLALDPFVGDIQKIKGETNVWRRRIGPYRILYEIHTAKKIIYVFELQRRTSATY